MIYFLALVLTHVMNSGVKITPVICSSFRWSWEQGWNSFPCLQSASTPLTRAEVSQGCGSENRLPQAQRATGEQRFPKSDNLDTTYGNVHRHPDRQGKFKISFLSITSHNHSSILPQSLSHANPVHCFLFAFFLSLFRQRPSSHKTSRRVTYCQMRQNTK